VATGDTDTAQDLVSEAFARALERWERIEAMESPTGWVRQVAINLLRRRMRRATLEQQILRRQPVVDLESPSYAIEPELWTAVAALPDRQRAVVGLRVVLDLSQEETARLLRIRPGTVSAALVAARRNVAQSLRDPAPSVTAETEVRHA
jgi:RNA polymerase sigma factor (sigma-70 family)